MQIGIIGLGFVGNAIFTHLSSYFEVIGYDKYKNGGVGTFENILQCDIIYLCLPIPFDDSLNKYDTSALYETCFRLHMEKYTGIILIKSTVEPKTCEKLAHLYHLNIIHNPEFLTARTALQDFKNQNHIVLGFTPKIPSNLLIKVTEYYSSLFPNATISTTT